jgi:hypothetical protein
VLLNLKGELIKKGKDPVAAIISAIGCSEKTARNKLNGIHSFTIPEAIKISSFCFKDDKFEYAWLFENSGDESPAV